jgi:small subunit ribosomal protein S16
MLKIRLQRTGKRGQAYFRLVVTEHTTKPKGKYLEFLGSYDPHKNEISVKADRVKYWLSVGAKLSETANNLLVGKGIIEGKKVKVWRPKKKGKQGTPGGVSTTPAEGQNIQETPAAESAEVTPSASISEKPQETTPKEPKTEETTQPVS